MDIDYRHILTKITQEVLQLADRGIPATYIPELTAINPDTFGVYLQPIDKIGCGVGDYNKKFSIQSIAKVFLLVMAYKIKGKESWERVGYEPSGDPFNSLVQLETENGIPRNPLINAGAIVVCDLLLDLLPNPKEDFLEFVRKLAVDNSIQYNEKIAKSEAKTGFTNRAIANLIKSYGNLNNDVEEVLEMYFYVCAIEMSCQELSKSFLLFANGGVIPETGERILSLSRTKRVNAIMQTCGFYDEAGEFAFKVGLPGKSGVGGGIVAVHPSKYSVAVWSPRLNKKGNSFKGMKLLELLTTETHSSIF
jgi:glutaminase